MVYRNRYSPVVSPTPPPSSNPGSNPGSNPPVSNTRKSVPMMWVSAENFDIGQETVGGGHLFDGEHLINVADMTPEQLATAAKELHRELKRELIEKRELELMKKIATTASTPVEYHDRFAEEPFLMIRETPPGDPLLGDTYDTIEKIRAKIDEWLTELNLKLTTKEALRLHIGTLGGPVIPPPVGVCQELSEVDKLKMKVGVIEKHLVPTPGTPPATEEVTEIWPGAIPEAPDVPEAHGVEDLGGAWIKLHALQTYLTNLRLHYVGTNFNMGWCLEMARVCLNELKAAKAPGTQTDNYKANLDALSEGLIKLEQEGIFHD